MLWLLWMIMKDEPSESACYVLLFGARCCHIDYWACVHMIVSANLSHGLLSISRGQHQFQRDASHAQGIARSFVERSMLLELQLADGFFRNIVSMNHVAVHHSPDENGRSSGPHRDGVDAGADPRGTGLVALP